MDKLDRQNVPDQEVVVVDEIKKRRVIVLIM